MDRRVMIPTWWLTPLVALLWASLPEVPLRAATSPVPAEARSIGLVFPDLPQSGTTLIGHFAPRVSSRVQSGDGCTSPSDYRISMILGPRFPDLPDAADQSASTQSPSTQSPSTVAIKLREPESLTAPETPAEATVPKQRISLTIQPATEPADHPTEPSTEPWPDRRPGVAGDQNYAADEVPYRVPATPDGALAEWPAEPTPQPWSDYRPEAAGQFEAAQQYTVEAAPHLVPQQPAMPIPGTPQPVQSATGALLAPPEAFAPRCEQLERIAQQADRQTRRGFELASRGAYFAARSQFIKALRLVAQGLDTQHQTDAHSRSLAAGLTALREAEDFIPTGSRLEADLDVPAIIDGHRTPVIKNVNTENLTPLSALQCYFTFAQEQLAAAAGSEVASSMALQGLGKLHAALAGHEAGNVAAAESKAVTFYQAALLTFPRNYMAANDLGVLLARCGNYREAEAAMKYSLSIYRQPIGLGNLAVVYRQLGQAALARQAQQFAVEARRPGLPRPDPPRPAATRRNVPPSPVPPNPVPPSPEPPSPEPPSPEPSQAPSRQLVRWVDPSAFNQFRTDGPAIPTPRPIRAEPAETAQPILPVPTVQRSILGWLPWKRQEDVQEKRRR